MDPLLILLQLFTRPSLSQTKTNILAIAGAAGLTATAFVLGEPSERWIEIAARAIDAWGAVPDQASRGFFLDLATDPGDVDVFGNPDTSPDQTPRPGWLSTLGVSWYGTTRRGQTAATGLLTVTNASGAPVTFHPFDLTFERDTTTADGGVPTYRNAFDSTIYIGIGGTLTLGPSASATIPIIADQLGTASNATATHINHVTTQSFGLLTCSNPSAALGSDREDAALYRARCRLAADKLSPGGPLRAYQYAANTQVDPATGQGTPLLNFNGGTPVGIVGAYVSPASATGEVLIYYYGTGGLVTADEVSSANANIGGVLLADPVTGAFHNPTPLGIVPDTVTLLPTVSDPATLGPGGASVANTTIAVTYSAKIKASAVKGGATPGTFTSGGSPPTNIAAVFAAIAAAVDAYLPSLGPGALDITAGVGGVVYTSDIGDVVREAYAGLYAVSLSAPSGSTTAIALTSSAGHIAVAGAITGTLVVVAG